MFTVIKTVTMKNVLKATLLACILTTTGSIAFAQNETAVLVPKATAMIETPTAPAPAPAGKAVIITLHNAAEKSVAVFAGHKEDLKEPKITVVGGSSRNVLYLTENDAVCLMTVDKRPAACTIIKPGMSTVEVNVSANGISGK
jgi:hypothetical protein